MNTRHLMGWEIRDAEEMVTDSNLKFSVLGSLVRFKSSIVI